MAAHSRPRIAVMTSGGDAQGMNAALRAVVRTALSSGADVFAIYEGYKGMVSGGDYIRKMEWGDVGGILQRGGTVIGTARSLEFRERGGRLQAARNLIEHEIDKLVVIGGDGSLTGANLFRQEWNSLLAELVETGIVEKAMAERHPALSMVGMVGSIDNDMFGTDMTIGADTALHRITEALDAIASTAASHQRTFVVEVMGRNCGYLALMSAIAGGADWVLIPEMPPEKEHWEQQMCDVLEGGRKAGRRDSIVIVAEGARDWSGNPITVEHVQRVLEERLGEDTRVTILGHVQRGGAPSAFDRTMSTQLGHAAVRTLLDDAPSEEPLLIGIHENRVTKTPLMHCVEQTHAVADAIQQHDYERAMDLRGSSFRDTFRILRTLTRVLPHPPRPGQRRLRLAILHGGGPAPGMNTVVRVAVRLGIDQGHLVFGVRNGFQGLMDGDMIEMDWMSVSGWATMGGAELGVSRKVPTNQDLDTIAQRLAEYQIDGLMMIGGWSGYQSTYRLHSMRLCYPALDIPIICLPATINNNLPGSELSIGADTALNSIVLAVDKIKQSAVASRRCFVVEVMGRECGYLALMGGLATGAERVYLPEHGIRLSTLQSDLENLIQGFRSGKRLGLLIRNERANALYTSSFICALLEEEGGNLFDVRQSVLGHIQQGGDPTPFDRILATRLAARGLEFLIEKAGNRVSESAFVGLRSGKVQFFDLGRLPEMIDEKHRRPREQWWLNFVPIAQLMAHPDRP